MSKITRRFAAVGHREAISIIAGLLLVVVPCVADMESTAVGPFIVSFDLGIPDMCLILPDGPTHGKNGTGWSYWDWEIAIVDVVEKAPYGRAFIKIRENHFPTAWDPASAIETLNRTLDLPGCVAQNRTITKIGDREVLTYIEPYLYTEIAPTRYGCMFIPEIQGTEVVVVTITSTFPWEAGTQNLFKSIKVERV